MAETCFAERWPLARARQIANACGLVDDDDEADGLIGCQFIDHSTVYYCKDTGDIFCIQLTYDVRDDGKLVAPQMDDRWELTPEGDIKPVPSTGH
jgi:hypothetical protein